MLNKRRAEVVSGRFLAPRAAGPREITHFRGTGDGSLAAQTSADPAAILRHRPLGGSTPILQRIGQVPAAEITPQLLADLFLDLGRNGADRGHPRPEGLTGSTLNRYRALISSIFTWAIQVGPPRSESARRRQTIPGKCESRVRYLLECEEKRLRDVIRRDCPAREAELDLSLYSGMRKETVAAEMG